MAITESNLATSSVRAAANIVLTVSTICLWPAVRGFCWASAIETLSVQTSAKTTMANAMRGHGDMIEPSSSVERKDASTFYLFLSLHEPPTTFFISDNLWGSRAG